MIDKQAVHDRVVECLVKGNQKFGSYAKIDRIVYMGNASKDAGKAVQEAGTGNLIIKLSVHYLEREFDWVMDEIIPHEVAHIIGFWLERNGAHGSYGHDERWQEIAKYLGSSGAETPEVPETYQAGNIYKYRTSTGNVVTVNQDQHDQLQNFKVFKAQDGGRITADGLVKKKARN